MVKIMIAYVKGILAEKGEGYVVVEASGVGFEIKVNNDTITRLPAEGREVKLLTHLQISENDRVLYGFLTSKEKETFRHLISVSSVGPKNALSIMNTMNLMELTDAVMANDVKSISKAPGIGSKIAQRIIIELKDKLEYTGEMLFGETVFNESETDSVSEAAEALEALGFARTDALKAIRKVNGADKMDTEELLKAALKAMKS